jgi:hypothetical protein
MGATVAGVALHACSKTGTPPAPTAAPTSAASAATVGGPASAPVAKRSLGKTGEQVSMIGLVGAHMGRQKDEQESIRIVRHAIDHGITFMDNCWDYNEGRSEERMGKALADGYRQKVLRAATRNTVYPYELTGLLGSFVEYDLVDTALVPVDRGQVDRRRIDNR